ncbi:MAG: FAD-binding protein, partial [Chitinophagales bacterium]
MTTIADWATLKPYNTFKIDATARHLLKVKQVADLQALIDTLWFQQTPKLIIGGGSNLLFTQNYNGLILLNCLKGRTLVKETKEEVYLRLASGENWHETVQYAVQQRWAGIE